MKKITSITVLSCLLVLTFYCCTDRPVKKSDKQPINSEQDILPDSLFAFQNIKNSLVINHFQWDTNGNCYYQDLTKKIGLIQLDSSQKRRYISSMPGFAPDWIMNDWQVCFVSKQDKIGEFTPIVVWAGGTDYGALILILLDKTYHPVSYFELSGGECGDEPSYCDLRHSFFNNNEIRSYIRKKVWRKDNSFTGYVDSVNYRTRILPTGKFDTERIDSTRYKINTTDQ